MSLQILNLDEIASEDKQVKLGGQIYIIPGDLPVMTMLNLIENANRLQEAPNDPKLQEKAFELLADIFMIRDEKFDAEKFKKRLTMKQYTTLISFIFRGFSDSETIKKQTPEASDEKKPE